jgi:FKBP-type peptidyl-prolyl cis-trans isomerase
MTKTLAIALAALGLCFTAGAAQAQAAAAPPAATASSPAADFLAKNAKEPGVKVLPSGLQYKVIKSGDAKGGSPKAGDAIKVNYEGSLVDGQVFDSSFQRGKAMLLFLEQLVPAWMEAVPMMHAGDEWMLYAPPELGYGGEGAGPIPPNSVLIFRLQLVGFLSAD